MKAIIIKGKEKGCLVTISQFCNDWFTIQGSTKVYSPSSLAFNDQGFSEIVDAAFKNKAGSMMSWFEFQLCTPLVRGFIWTLKKIRHAKK